MFDEIPIIMEPILESVDDLDGRWRPKKGRETISFLENTVPAISRESIFTAAKSILSQGINPRSATDNQRTGLVVGYVQSGKTMSFESVIALARDNAFQVAIVITGTSKLLLKQTDSRLRSDLRIDTGPRRWMPFSNPSEDDAEAISSALRGWKDPQLPDKLKKTLLITILKNHTHLENLSKLFSTSDIDMKKVPVLLIDDEADQASLNTQVADQDQSTTYRKLVELRKIFPSHTYLQYTATPQAPLMINIIDTLSPDFVQVLEPGTDYVGGKEFFNDELNHVREIPNSDVPTPEDPLDGPPASLMEAIRVFMIGVAAGLRTGGDGNRSMLVHPSELVAKHMVFFNWTKSILRRYERTFNLSSDDPDKVALVKEFHMAYQDISKTEERTLCSFDELLPLLPYAFGDTRVSVINHKGEAEVDWERAYGCVLIGGKTMGRGVTVRGLTVTYMPRGIGAGNADTIQQRARFFGYKKPYFGYCRLYLEHSKLEAFQNYVEHEEHMRGQLLKLQKNSSPLRRWKRNFILSPSLRPCRKQVLELGYARGSFSNKWVQPDVIDIPDSIIQINRDIVKKFIYSLNLIEDSGHADRTDFHRHKISRGIRLSQALKQLLVRIQVFSTKDIHDNIGLLLQLERALEKNPDEVCTIYQMSFKIRRERSLRDGGTISYLFQGPAPVRPVERQGSIYPGDLKLHDADDVTIQLHTIDLTEGKEIVKRNVPVVAVWVPERLAAGWISQVQPAQEE